MFPWEPTRDIMRRTVANLKFIEDSSKDRGGPYEVTQLINSFLGAVAHPWERYQTELAALPLSALEDSPRLMREKPTDNEPQTLGDALRLLRNGIAHGNIDFLPGENGDIRALRICNYNRRQRTWGTIISVADLRRFLMAFVALAENLAEQEISSRKLLA